MSDAPLGRPRRLRAHLADRPRHVFLALGGRNEPRITTVLLDNLQNAEDEGMKEGPSPGPWPWKEMAR